MRKVTSPAPANRGTACKSGASWNGSEGDHECDHDPGGVALRTQRRGWIVALYSPTGDEQRLRNRTDYGKPCHVYACRDGIHRAIAQETD